MKIGPRAPITAPTGSPSQPAPTAAAPVTSPAAGWVAKGSVAGLKPVAETPTTAPGAVVTRFYEAFEQKNVDAMEQLYARDVQFKDAIFTLGSGAEAAHMWRQLFKTDPNAKLKFTLDSVSGDTVKGHWVADYRVLGRPVHNEVSTTMQVRDGKIVSHRDDFSWKKWAPQAFPAGALFTLPGLDALAKAAVRAVLS